MDLEYFVERIEFNKKCSIPSVVILLVNQLPTLIHSDPVPIKNNEELNNTLKQILTNKEGFHRTAFVLGLDVYRKSELRVGDRLVIGVTRKNLGEISP